MVRILKSNGGEPQKAENNRRKKGERERRSRMWGTVKTLKPNEADGDRYPSPEAVHPEDAVTLGAPKADFCLMDDDGREE
jgi:hypothetical protein